MRTIDADALLKKIEEDADFYLVGDDENSKAVGSTLLGVKEQINAMPTVELQRMRGKWIDKGWNGDWQYQTDGRGRSWHEWQCSECNHIIKGAKWNYCPNCGADMRGTG